MRGTTAAMLASGAVLAAALAGGRYAPRPDHPRTVAWYARLDKPSYTPPGPAFGIAWTVLDSLLAFTGYRLLTARPQPARTYALGAWGVSVGSIAAQPWLFFGRKQLGASLGAVGTLLAASIATVAFGAKVDRIAATAGVPLVAWTAFAGLLNEEIWRENA